MFKSLLLSAVLSLPIFSDGFEASAAVTCLNGTKLDLGDGQPLIRLTGSVCNTAAGDGTVKAPCVKNTDGTCARVTPPVPPQPVCGVLPAGWSYLNDGNSRPLTYSSIAFGAIYPSGPNFLSPVGSFSSRSTFNKSGQDIAGKVISVPVTMTAANRAIRWLEAQPVAAAGYRTGMPATAATVIIDRCKGVVQFDSTKHCGGTEYSGNVVYGPTAGLPQCRFPVGTTVYLNISFPNTTDTVNPAKNACAASNASGGKKCDANFTFR